MSTDALRATTVALQRLIHTAVGRDKDTDALTGSPDDWVYIGPPIRGPLGVGDCPVSLFLFHVVPNGELRNAPRYVTRLPESSDRPDLPDATVEDPKEIDAIALDAHYLISVHRPDNGQDPSELTRLGEIVAQLQALPTLSGALLPGQEVRLTPEPYSMEEISRIWGLFPGENYRTSMVYLAAPIFVDARDLRRGAPIARRRVDAGQSGETPDVFGVRRTGT